MKNDGEDISKTALKASIVNVSLKTHCSNKVQMVQNIYKVIKNKEKSTKSEGES